MEQETFLLHHGVITTMDPIFPVASALVDAAYASFQENELGSITPGKLADLVVLPENLLTCDAKSLLKMPVLYTILNGKIIYANHTRTNFS